MSDKQYLSADQLLVDSFRLAERVFSSGFKPTMIIAIWRGGVPIGIAVQEFLAYCGIETDHIAIRTSSYDAGIDQRLGGIRVHGLNYLIKNVTAEEKLLNWQRSQYKTDAPDVVSRYAHAILFWGTEF